jgi:GTP-binding protein
VVADVPGLIEGAHEGKGLGHDFLRHIERSAAIVHVVDLTGSYESRDVIEDYEIIERELALHATELTNRPRVIVGNKADVVGVEEADARLRERAERDEVPYFAVSAVTGEGIDSFVLYLGEMVHGLRSSAAAALEESYEHAWVHDAYHRDQREFEVRNLGGGVFSVEGANVERMVIMTEWANDEALAFLQKRLVKAGVEKALVDAGARDGDEIRIAGRSFIFDTGVESDPEIAFIEDEPEEDEDQ